MEETWQKVKNSVKFQIPGHSFRMWIAPIEFGKTDAGNIVLRCPNHFSKKRVEEQYGPQIAGEFQKTTGRDFRLIFEVSNACIRTEADPLGKDPQLLLPHMQPSGGRLLRRDFTFDRFVVGDSNHFAYSAAVSQATGNGNNSKALFLFSGTGMGKSHLSQAIGNHVLSQAPSQRVYYITAEDFTNEMVQALRTDAIAGFKEKYRNQCDVLLMEDVHFLTGKDRTQVELALTLDYLLDAKKRIIFTGCYCPSDIPKMNDQLKSRLSGGLISNIEPPDYPTRIKILERKALDLECHVSGDVIHYLAGELTENIRQLESGLIGLTARSSLLNTSIDLKLAESVVLHLARKQESVTIDGIKKLVCRKFGISVQDIVSKSRKQNLVRPRQIAIYLSRRYTREPLQAIGRSFNRYHATALHSINAVERGIKTSTSLRRQVELLCRDLESSHGE